LGPSAEVVDDWTSSDQEESRRAVTGIG
jgi:hypothetical protein